MLRNEEFFNDLNRVLNKNYKPSQTKTIVTEINSYSNIPVGLLTDYIIMRTPIDDASDFILYSISKYFFSEAQIKKYFTSKEIKQFDKTKYQEKKFKFPYTFKMIQVASDQWIGTITVKELMALRDAQIINYNDQTQRPLERKVSHGIERYQIAISQSAVKAIEESYEKDSYIPNTITLNMPEDAMPEFTYNPETSELIIKKLKQFDITDGYHRYRAMSKVCLKNPDFDYGMELRITNFPESKAKQFIWQEDQKTKMSKISSDSFNQNDAAVQICERLSADTTCNVHGLISRNQGIISTVYLSSAIRSFLLDKGKNDNLAVINITNKLKQQLNEVTATDTDLLVTPWSKEQTYCIICVLSQRNDDYINQIQTLLKRSTEEDTNSYLWAGEFSQRKATALIKLLDEGVMK